MRETPPPDMPVPESQNRETVENIPSALPDELIPISPRIRYAAVAMLVSDEGNYLLQLRDGSSGIWHPNMLCFFGGRIDGGEEATTALRRELKEELEYCPGQLTYFSYTLFGTAGFSPGPSCRIIYEVKFNENEMKKMVLHEGAGVKLVAPSEILNRTHSIIPVDLQVLYVHLMQRKIVAQPDG